MYEVCPAIDLIDDASGYISPGHLILCTPEFRFSRIFLYIVLTILAHRWPNTGRRNSFKRNCLKSSQKILNG